MDLTAGKKILFQMQQCFAKLKLPIHSETEVLNNEHASDHLEFSTLYGFDEAGEQKLSAKFYFSLKMVELSLYLHLNYEEYKRIGIIHLLNCINLVRVEAQWALCDCCNEIELRYASRMGDKFSEKYFKQMVKKIIYLGKSFIPVIHNQISSNEDPYKTADIFFENNKKLMLTELVENQIKG